MGNKNLHDAKKSKNDEFYTKLEDIENELKHYEHYFKDKVVYCNGDDYRVSNFVIYFSRNFWRLGLKRLIATCYIDQTPSLFDNTYSPALCYIYDGNDTTINPLRYDGDFRRKECVEILKQADIICTNPPFSLFRNHLDQIIKHNKKFLTIGNMNAIAYKEIFPLIKDNKIWLGATIGSQKYIVPDSDDPELALTRWFTNLEHGKRNNKIEITKKYNATYYPHYDNYDAIEVDRVANIPSDWEGVMGVPISFLDKYNPEQFEIVGFRKGDNGRDLRVNGKEPYARILIRKILQC